MTDYYVATSGSDSASGLSGAPWQTIAKVNAATFAPGDNIYFNRGDTWTGDELIPSVSGTAGSPITFGAYGSGALPIIDGNGTAEHNIDTNQDMLSPRSWLVFEDLECINTVGIPSENTVGGIKLSGSHNIARRCVSHSHTRHSASLYVCDDNEITDCTLSDCSDPVAAIFQATNSRFLRNSLSQASSNNGVLVCHDACANITIEENLLSSAVAGHHFYCYDTCAGITFKLNYLTDLAQRGVFVKDCTDVDLFSNVLKFSTINDIGIVYDNSTGGVAGNTLHWTTGSVSRWAFHLISGTATFKNNICQTRVYVKRTAGTLTSDYNCFFGHTGSTPFTWDGTAYSLANWLIQSGGDSHSISSDPQLSSNMTLWSASPCLLAGVDLGSDYDESLSPTSSWPSSVGKSQSDWNMGAFNRYTLEHNLARSVALHLAKTRLPLGAL